MHCQWAYDSVIVNSVVHRSAKLIIVGVCSNCMLNWKTLEYRRTISRLTLLYKSVHSIVAINIDEHHTNHEEKKYYNKKNVLNFLYSSYCQKELLQVHFYR